MRKALLIMGLAVAVFAVGCSDNSSNNGGSGDSSGKTGTTLVEEAEVDEFGWEEVVPKYDDIFVSGELNIDTNNEIQYYIRIENCNFDEYIKYRDLCKSSGYNKEVYQDDTGFTYDSKKYRVSAGYITDTKQAWIAFEHLKNEGSAYTISSSDSTVSEEVPTKDLSTMIPNPNDVFTSEEISFNNYGDLVTGSVKNAERSEFDTYKQKCKDAGFDTVDYDSEDDSGSLYMGYNNDKSYKVRLFFAKKDNSVEITLETENN